MTGHLWRWTGCMLMLCCLSLWDISELPAIHSTADSVAKKASGKFGRGIVNIATGWGEMIRCPMEIGRENGAFLAATWGPLKGVAMTILRALGGVCETGMFFYPLPGDYDPYFESAFVFSPSPSGPSVFE